MANHTFNVSFSDTAGMKVTVVPNPERPDGILRAGDTATWTLIAPDGLDPDVEMQVGFTDAFELPPDGSEPKSVGPIGPFDHISRGRNQNGLYEFKGTIDSGTPQDLSQTWHYVCVVFRNGRRFPWEDGVNTHRPPLP